MHDPDALTARVTELEARFTLQQDVIDKLHDEIWRQQRDLEALVKRLASLESRLAHAKDGGGDAPPDEVPPHY